MFTQVILSRIFHGALGVDTVKPALRKIAWSVAPTPEVLRAAPVGSGHVIIRRSMPYLSIRASQKSHVVAPPVSTISSNTHSSDWYFTAHTADMGDTLKSRPTSRGSTGISLISGAMLASLKLIATRPLRFSKLASNSCRKVRLSSCPRAASISSGGTLSPSIVVNCHRFQSFSASTA